MALGFFSSALGAVLASVGSTAPYWLPVVLLIALAKLHLHFVQARFIKNAPMVLLEIKLPKEITKTPRSMELALTALYQTWDGDNLLIGQWLQGQLRSWFSLELVSIEGDIHFYLWTQRFHRRMVESQLYAQYPDIDIVEVDDYTARVPYGQPGSDWKLYGSEFALSKPDPYPIKTYVDYGLDVETKEEFKADPLTAMLEFLGSVGPGEQVWVQILVMASRDRFKKPGTWFGKRGWKDEGKALVKKLTAGKGGDESFPGLFSLSPGERRVVEQVERSIDKLGFDCGIRAMYLYRKNSFNPFNIVALLSSLKQYNSPELNGFKSYYRPAVIYPWQDPTGHRVARMKRRFFDSYCRRAYFYPPYVRKSFVLNTEELATIFHFPGRVATTPTLAKIGSKRSEPPANLPL